MVYGFYGYGFFAICIYRAFRLGPVVLVLGGFIGEGWVEIGLCSGRGALPGPKSTSEVGKYV